MGTFPRLRSEKAVLWKAQKAAGGALRASMMGRRSATAARTAMVEASKAAVLPAQPEPAAAHVVHPPEHQNPHSFTGS